MMGARLKTLVFGVLALMIGLGLASGSRASDYDGPDGGLLVYSVGSIAIPMNFTFRYRGLAPAPGASRPWAGQIGCGCVGLFGPRRDFDFTGRESGRVVIERLPPGDYEIHDFGFGGSLGPAVTSFSSGRPFAIPFTIRTGEATYIGGFARAPSLGTALQPVLGATGFFVVSDQSTRDLAIARRRRSDLPTVTVQVADVSAFGHPSLRVDEP